MPSPRIKIFFILLLACAEEVISTPKLITFWPNPPLGCEKLPFESNTIPYLLSWHFSTWLLCLVIITSPNRQFSKLISKLLRFNSNS